MWTKPACWGVQIIGLGILTVGLLFTVTSAGTGAVYVSILIVLAGLGLIVLGGVKIRERIRRDQG